MLNKLTENNILENDNYNRTELKLFDYDWMSYLLEAYFDTDNNGKMYIKFEYNGFITSEMKIVIDNKKEEYTYQFDTEIFKIHIIKYMNRHIKTWDDTYAFDGTQEVIDFYNEVLEKGTLVRYYQEDIKFGVSF